MNTLLKYVLLIVAVISTVLLLLLYIGGNDFIKLCMIRGWIVNQIDVDTRVDIYAKAEENIELE